MKALIFGCTGQDGSYLAEYLLKLGYEVHGVVRPVSNEGNLKNIELIIDGIKLHVGDVTDLESTNDIIFKVRPDEIYNLAAQSSPSYSWTLANYTMRVNGYGTLNILNAMNRYVKKARMFNAVSAQIFSGEKISESTITFNPNSPYSLGKMESYFWSKYARDNGLYVINGILFNHESARRLENFVTRKITRGVVKYYKTEIPLEIGNMYSQRDWGHSKDFVRAYHMTLQQNNPEDYVICTGKNRTVKEFIKSAFHSIGIYDIKWEGSGTDEIGYITDNKVNKFFTNDGGKYFYNNDKKGVKHIVVKINEKFYRKEENIVSGDNTKIKSIGWKPEISFDQMIDEMIKADLHLNFE